MIENEEYKILASMCNEQAYFLRSIHPPIDWEQVEYYEKLAEKLLLEVYN